ncbi:MAG TPA: hypothetical protein VF519_12960 [Mycobacteriales bacterium]
MIRRLAAPAVLAGVALLAPPAHADVCRTGPDNCPNVVVEMALNVYWGVDARVDDARDAIPTVIYITPLPVQQCIPRNDIFNAVCVP